MRPLLVVLLALVASPAWAQGAPDPKKDFDQKMKAQGEKAAREHVTLGKFCTGKKIHEVALVEYRRALQLDPACTDAKKGLMWKYEGGAWVEDPAAKIKTQNEGTAEAIEKAVDEHFAKRRTAGEKIAKDYGVVAEWATKKGLKAEARAAWKMAYYYDDNDEKVREGCGWVKDGYSWVSPEDADARAAEEKRIKEADGGKKVEERSDVEAKTGWALSKRHSKHFLFEGMPLDSQMTTLVKTCEAARLSFLETFELPADALEEPIRGVFLKSKDDHKNFLVKFVGLKGRELDEENAMSGWTTFGPMTFEVRQGERDFSLLEDWAVHCTIEFLWAKQFGIENCPPWLGEGIPYWFTYRMTKSALTNCIVFETASQGGQDWHEVLTWKTTIKDLVKAGKNPLIRDVLEARLNALDGPKGVKGWSLVEWMLARRRKEFFQFVNYLGGGTSQEDAIKKAFGVSGYAELDAQWVAYVLENY
jgi:hypothetical protein